MLDVQLPDMNGRDIARGIRGFSMVPIIMVMARGEIEDRVTGLDAGATDYVVKPFAPAELLARIRAATRRSAPVTSATLNFRDLTLDLAALNAFKDGKQLDLSVKEFELLRALIQRAGAVVRRDELTRAIWGIGALEGSNTLDVHLSWVRKKLGDDWKQPSYIETIRGIGFRMRVAEPDRASGQETSSPA